jgi:dTMP kinase
VAAADEVAALRGTRPATFRDLLTHSQFSKLFVAMLVSSLGSWVGLFAVTSMVVELDDPRGAAFAVAGVMIARMLPSVLFGPFAGVLVDRMDRKRLMVVADVGRGAMYAVLPLFPRIWIILLLSFAIECLSLVWTPARDSVMPNVVPRRQLANANSISLFSTYGTLPLGGAIFTVLAGVGSASGVPYFQANQEFVPLWLVAGTFLVSALMVSRMEIRSPKSRTGARFDPRSVGKDIIEGIRFLRQHSLAGAMTVSIVLAFSGVGAVLALGPVFAQQTVDAGAAGWGILVTSMGVGMGIGMAALGPVSKVIEREVLFPFSMLAAAGALFVLAAMPTIELAAGFTVVLGFFVGMTWVTGYTLLQENIADEYRGRTFGSLTVMARLGLFLSLAGFPILAGVVGDHVFFVGEHRIDLSGARLALWIAGVFAAVGGVSARRGLKRHRVTRPRPLSLRARLKATPRQGEFIVFEGVEGAGKGTQIRLARELLEEEGFEVLVTREPGGTELGEMIRPILLDHETGPIDPRTEALLFAAARAQHVTTVLRPALEAGRVVLCDRYLDSSLAYQGVARGLGEQDILSLNVWATQGLFPDFVILLHVEPELGLLRSTKGPDRIESEEASFHAKVADAYLRIAEDHPERFVVVDADKPTEEVHADVRTALLRFLRGREDDAGEFGQDAGHAGRDAGESGRDAGATS